MSALEETEVAEGVIVRDMLIIYDAVDLWLGDLARRGRSPRTRDAYRRILDKFGDRFPRTWDVAKITTEDCERFLDLWAHRSNGTQSQVYAPLNGFFAWLYKTRRVKTNPMEFVPTVTRTRSEDLDVTTVSVADVQRLLAEAKGWTEKNALYILACIGPRRHAAALLRLRDYDRQAGMIRFREKGGKTIWKPVPDELAQVLDASIAAGAVTEPDDYLIPPAGPLFKPGDRDDRVVFKVVKDVAKRCGIEAHAHALRAAFAVYYLQSNPGDTYGLQQLLGHSSPTTTQIYLRRFDKATAMENVRSLSWTGNKPVSGIPQIAEERYDAAAVAAEPALVPILQGSWLPDRSSRQPTEASLENDLLLIAARAYAELVS